PSCAIQHGETKAKRNAIRIVIFTAPLRVASTDCYQTTTQGKRFLRRPKLAVNKKEECLRNNVQHVSAIEGDGGCWSLSGVCNDAAKTQVSQNEPVARDFSRATVHLHHVDTLAEVGRYQPRSGKQWRQPPLRRF
ncbi:MAG: hypothetical protein ACF8AM_14915, partial [Rhodopirellula sp. JB055]|uniref:hypothetical protein n=1 Tax=Rhodopirellula sp. JB055 TaxID=3342846 RepID=UPI00370CB9B4